MVDIKELFSQYGITISLRQAEQFEKYTKFLIEENEKYNLTAITDEKEIVVKHFIDSCLPYNEIALNAKVIDVGTGAGFPGVPLKILRDDLKLTLVDSLQKRVGFLEQLMQILGINDVRCVHARAEDYVKEGREKFDYAISRAVASMPTLCEYLIPYVKVGGKVLMYKGQKGNEELAMAKNAITLLGGQYEKTLNFDLNENGARNIYIIKKIKLTDKKFPRGKNLPKIKPII